MATPAQALTAIVACYNIAPFVGDCLRSLFRQSLAERMRVLVVDDGSTDHTATLCRIVMAQHPGIDCELIHQPNQGLSAARNTGLDRVRTPYVAFVDGDDEWSPEFLARTLPIMERARADIIAFNASIVDLQGRPIDRLRCHSLPCGDGAPPASELATDAARIGEWQAWCRIYRTDHLRELRFPPGRTYEDAATVPQLYARASHIEVLAESLYRYRRRPGSITSHVTDKHVDDLLQNLGEAAARMEVDRGFWCLVHQSMLVNLAMQLGQAPAGVRRAGLARSWREVRRHPGLALRSRWLRILGSSLIRSEVKRRLGLRGGTALSLRSS